MNQHNDSISNNLLNTDYSEDVIREFVGKNGDYYIEKWGRSDNPEKKSSWNWVAFIAGVFWLGYRKMYNTMILFLSLFIVIDIIQFFIKIDLNSGVIGGAVSAILGVSGNTFYYKHMKKKLAKVSENANSIEELKEIASKIGGTSWIGVGVSVLLFIAYILITNTIQNVLVMAFS